MKLRKKSDSETVNHFFRTGWRMVALAWRLRPSSVVGYAVGAVLEIGGSLVSIYATAKLGSLLAHYLIGRSVTSDIWFWLWIDIGSAVLIALGFWAMSYYRRLLYFQIVQWSTTEFFRTMARLDIADFDDNNIRNQINKAQNGYTWQLSNLADSCFDFAYAVVRFLAMAAVVAQISWWVIPVLALFLLPSLLAEGRLQKLQWFVWDTKGDNRHVFWGLDWILRRSPGQMEARSLQAKEYLLQKLQRMNREFYREQESEYRRLGRISVPTKLLEAGGTALGSIVVLRQFLQGSILLDRYFFLSGALLRIGGALNTIFRTAASMQEPLLFAENFFALTSRTATIMDVPNARPLQTKEAPEIVFENVSFTYPGQIEPVFRDLSFTIAAGQHVALVGENGAGKSTLIKLLLRFYRPTSGRILIDGQDLQELAIETWYARLATLFQSFNQYPFSVRENIEIARPEHAGDTIKLRQAADFGRVEEIVDSYKYGWQTVLDNSFEKGVEPSGGQWQRVALARAFYRDANVLILDEPTAAIDAKAEYEIFNNIFDHYKERTAIIVSHRFSTVRRADRIIVIEDGQIVEQGSHRDLIKAHGLYYDLFIKQAEGYKD